ncbi:hypothetical protein ST201phi2-1p113 [Pseudomonas phage 201phi2-1]|uniref:Uncharacterized protein n=1 Tax=Pseudomonas phage 201phi2-1 TaxID=198110 RepID=B3FIX6_BP201|nr:hypothetical protein ST201phi2-1p113 [Pseudomonas phage 201phi2-1]ABY62945.1 hypothetical protein 201phi2-1p113 [Pseudomonas phage 201phi2-1]
MVRTEKTIDELLAYISLNRPERGYDIMSVDGKVIHVIGTTARIVVSENRKG